MSHTRPSSHLRTLLAAVALASSVACTATETGFDCDSCVRSICAAETLPSEQPIDFYTASVVALDSGNTTFELVRREGGRGTTAASVGDVETIPVAGAAADALEPLSVGDQVLWMVLENDDGTVQLWGEPYRIDAQGDPECRESGGQEFSAPIEQWIETALDENCRDLLRASGTSDRCDDSD